MLPVVLFHAGLAGFSGGYVGVDVFFVISGYLITGILLGDMARGRYSILGFYRRRVRRIFPALALVVVATLVAGIVLLAPAALEDVARSALAVGAFGSNFFFWRSVDYFAGGHAVQPLLHTWSLAVEEQFYILFPPVLALLVRRRWPVLPSLAATAVLSLGLAAVLVFKKPSATFYLPVTRAWELLAGALLACGAFGTAPARLRHAAGLVGLLLTLLPVILYDARTPFPGLAALPPVLGAALVIWAGRDGGGLACRLLSTAPMVGIGRISYSLYLWHVPIFAYATYASGGTLSFAGSVAATIAAFGLAWGTYAWVETPFRAGPGPRARRPVSLGIAAMVGSLALAAGLVASAGWPGRLDERGRALIDLAEDKERFHRECLSVGETIVSPAKACRLGKAGVEPTALLWGDSHAMVTATAMEPAALARSRSFLFAATADCPVGIGFSIDDATAVGLTRTPSYRFCGDYNRQMLALALASPSIRQVVLSARWTNWRIGEPANPAEDPVDIRLRDEHGVAPSPAANAAVFERGFLRLVAALRAAGKQVFVVGPLPEPTFNVPERLFVERFGLVGAAGPITTAGYRRRHARILRFFADVERTGGVTFIWPASVLCRRDVCPIEQRGRGMFFDQDHLSIAAARGTAGLYAPVFP